METITLPAGKIDRLVLGAGRLGDPARKEDSFRVIDAYADAGFSTLDTARSYEQGRCEEFLGEYLSTRGRDRFFIISKGGFPLSRQAMHETRLSEKELRKDLEDSLKALKTDVIDLYFLHRDDVTVPPEEMLITANKFLKEGKVKAVGASNWTAGRIGQANKFAQENKIAPFCASQINYSLALTTPALTGDLTHIVMNDIEKRWYEETQLPLIAYSVQAKGFFSKVFSQKPLKESGRLSYPPLEENFRRAKRLKTLSEEKGVPMPALLIAFVLSQPLCTAAIGGFSDANQFYETLPGAQMRLTKKEIQFLENGEPL